MGDLGSLETNVSNGNKSELRFNSDDINYFNLFYESKLVNIVVIIKQTGKSIFFRNIYIFIDRVKDVTRVKGEDLLR